MNANQRGLGLRGMYVHTCAFTNSLSSNHTVNDIFIHHAYIHYNIIKISCYQNDKKYKAYSISPLKGQSAALHVFMHIYINL